FSSFLAGAGVKRGHVHGETDEYGIEVARDGVHVHDFHATILHLMGLDHERLTYRHVGRDFRLTAVDGKVVGGVLCRPDHFAFVGDTSPDAFARVVDRLLASSAYGERWGRHWLDLVRYADTAGDVADFPVREAYKYRNWVIDAFNVDMPYDAFVRNQIAGDIY